MFPTQDDPENDGLLEICRLTPPGQNHQLVTARPDLGDGEPNRLGRLLDHLYFDVLAASGEEEVGDMVLVEALPADNQLISLLAGVGFDRLY